MTSCGLTVTVATAGGRRSNLASTKGSLRACHVWLVAGRPSRLQLIRYRIALSRNRCRFYLPRNAALGAVPVRQMARLWSNKQTLPKLRADLCRR